MREPHQVLINICLFCLIFVSFSNSNQLQAFNYSPQSPPTDTSLAEQFIRQAENATKDSTTYFYNQAKIIYQNAKKETNDKAIWQRYFEVCSLWSYSLKDKKIALDSLLNYRKEAIDKFGENSLSAAENYYYYGKILANFGKSKWDEAIQHFQTAIKLYEAINFPVGIIKANGKLGEIFQEKAKYTIADKHYRTSLNQSLVHHGEKHPTTALYYKEISYNYYSEGQYLKAQATMDTLMELEAIIFTPDDPEKSAIYLLAGKIHFKQSAYNTAILYYEKAKEFYDQDSLKYRRQLGSCLGDIGAAELQKGDFDKANSLFIKAAELKKATVGENSVSLAYTYYNIGAGFAQQGNYQNALDYFFKSVGIIRIARGEQHPDVAYVYNGIGNVYMRQGDWKKANNYFQDALAIRKISQTTNHPAAARDYDKIGIMHQKNDELDLAQAAYEKALLIRQNTLKPKHLSFHESYLNLATIHLINNNLVEADTLFRKSLAILEEKLDAKHPSIAHAYFQLATIARKQNDINKSLAYYQTALVKLVPSFESTDIADNPTILASFPNKTRLSDLLFRKGATLLHQYLQQKDQPELLSQAYQAVSSSIDIADMVRQEFSFDFSKKAWLRESHVIYGKLLEISALMANQPSPEVTKADLFSLMEKSKSILLLESINDETSKVFAGIPESLINQENQLNKQIAYFENEHTRKKERGNNPSDKSLLQLEEKLFQFRQQYQAHIQKIEQDYPKYYQLKHDEYLASVADIQEILPNTKTVLLQYALNKNQLYVMAISQAEVKFHQEKIDSTFFNQLTSVKQFLNTNPSELNKSEQTIAKAQFIQESYQLYQKILAPILAKINQPKELVIIPDDALNYLPFEALLTGQPDASKKAFDQLDYLLQQYAIHYEYSATLWWQNRNSQHVASTYFGGFAPAYQGEQLYASRVASTSPTALGPSDRSASFSPLKYNQTEVNELAANLNGEMLLGAAATESAFKKQASNFGVLHLAMHAFVNDENPNYSHLVFSQEPDTTEDRYLYAYELYNMQLKADLAVLSACETGDGKFQLGEGVMSLSRAFKYAGVPNIVMSFWKADDFYTKNLMTHFYQFLQLGNGKNKALQEAKISQINAAKDNKAAAHPYYWANFVLVGDSQPVSFNDNKPLWWMAGSFLLLLILGGFWKWKFSQ